MNINEVIDSLVQIQEKLDNGSELDYHDGVHLFELVDVLERLAISLTPREARNLDVDQENYR